MPFPVSGVPKAEAASHSTTTTTTARIGWAPLMAVPLTASFTCTEEAPLSSGVTQAYRWVADGALSKSSF